MATKTITIDVEAYNRLKKVQQKNESFSQTIKRVVRPPFDFEKWRKKVEALKPDHKMIDAVDTYMRNRRNRAGRKK